MTKILIEIFAAYIMTAVAVNGGIFHSTREWVKARTPWLFKGEPARHMLDCRMCTGFWISALISVGCRNIDAFPLIYGASYFLATQER